MDILNFFTASNNLPFLVSGCIMFALLIIGVISLALGGLHHAFDTDIDFDADLDGNGIPDYLEVHSFNVFDWMNPGRLPSSVFLTILTTIYSIVGYTGQWIFDGLTGNLAPMILAGPVALALTFPVVRMVAIVITPLMPKDETNAITVESLVNQGGVVTAGPIGLDDFGMARFTDQHGTDHNLLVCAESDENIETGAKVVLLGPHKVRSFAFIVRKI